MSKRPLKLKVRIPEYVAPRNTWRQAIYQAVAAIQASTNVRYEADDRLEVALQLYFTHGRAAEIHDVDNRLKDVLDALQGRIGGTKTKARRRRSAIIPNDNQIWKVIVQKGHAPKQALGRGHLTIRRLTRA